jgi:hypothetical protein
MPRSKRSQSKHDTEVRRIAKQKQRQGYDVKADIPDFAKPDTIRGYRPDVIAQKGRKREIYEVETPDSKDSARDQGQQKAFSETADRAKNTIFKRKITD